MMFKKKKKINDHKRWFSVLQRRTSKKGLSIKLIAEVTKLDDKKILDLKRTLYYKGKKNEVSVCFVFLYGFFCKSPKKMEGPL